MLCIAIMQQMHGSNLHVAKIIFYGKRRILVVYNPPPSLLRLVEHAMFLAPSIVVSVVVTLSRDGRLWLFVAVMLLWCLCCCDVSCDVCCVVKDGRMLHVQLTNSVFTIKTLAVKRIRSDSSVDDRLYCDTLE